MAPGLPAAAGARGAAPVNFLLIDGGARPSALGGAYVSLADDSNALHYNPAGLAFLERHDASFMHGEHFFGTSQEYAGVALKGPLGLLGEGMGAGLLVNTVGYGAIQRTTLSNIRGAGLGALSARDYSVSFGYASRLPRVEWISAGLAAKWIHEEIDSLVADSGATDIGLMADLDGAFSVPARLGAALQNIGADLRYQSADEALPLNLRFGASWKPFKAAVLALDLNQPGRGDMTVHAGAEYGVAPGVALRLGYDGRNAADSGISAGIGLAVKGLDFGYAFAPFGSLGDSHRFSVAWHW